VPPAHATLSQPGPLVLPQRREALGLDPEGGDPDLEGLPDDVELEEAEPAELTAARDRLAAFNAARQAEAAGAEEDDAPPGAMAGLAVVGL